MLSQTKLDLMEGDAMDHADVTARIDQRLARRKDSVNEGYLAKWEKHFAKPDTRLDPWRSPGTTDYAAYAQYRHEQAMRAAYGLPPLNMGDRFEYVEEAYAELATRRKSGE